MVLASARASNLSLLGICWHLFGKRVIIPWYTDVYRYTLVETSIVNLRCSPSRQNMERPWDQSTCDATQNAQARLQQGTAQKNMHLTTFGNQIDVRSCKACGKFFIFSRAGLRRGSEVQSRRRRFYSLAHEVEEFAATSSCGEI
jgi:hypothetical protein